ncbi:DUF6233 domain-containing protein [Streptomyces sp. NPDC052015]|uniref:DUF6233 domain-containing protein n=1 Tax=Streptomyces sp. NPDC052015 TaxID=3154755 RepID=UPI00342733A1
MNDLPPDLPPDLARLRTVETFLALNLERVRAEIAKQEQLAAAPQRAVEVRPPAPEWLIEQLPSGRTTYVHAGDCWAAGKRAHGISREQARRALADGTEACPVCTPDTALGFVEG